MKTRPRDRMRDPFYAQLMYAIEIMISEADQKAKEQGVILKDSQVQSALIKAMGFAAGKTPKIEDSTDAERILKDLIQSLNRAPKSMTEKPADEEGAQNEKPLQMRDWILAIEAVVDSVKTRRSERPGSRDYLDFVQQFIDRASGLQ